MKKQIVGFSLVEMAVVLTIVGVLLAGLLPTLTSQVEQRRRTETNKQLDEIKQALLGFAVSNKRLPCPASSSNSNGLESFCTNALPLSCGTRLTTFQAHGRCSDPSGFIPSVTLGLSNADAQGYAIDGWNNRIRYAVTSSLSPSANAYAFTKSDGMANIGLGGLAAAPDLSVCASATGITGTACGTAASLTTKGVAVIYSLGRSGTTSSLGADETANTDGDQVFVSHVPSPASATNGKFDHIVTWLSPNTLYNRMIAAGVLP